MLASEINKNNYTLEGEIKKDIMILKNMMIYQNILITLRNLK